MNANDLNGLRWYLTRENNGRGKLTGETRRLCNAGLIAVRSTGFYTWVASITDKGREALKR